MRVDIFSGNDPESKRQRRDAHNGPPDPMSELADTIKQLHRMGMDEVVFAAARQLAADVEKPK